MRARKRESQRLLEGEGARGVERRDFADRVAGDHGVGGQFTVLAHLVVGQQCGDDDEWLGHGGVGDLLRRGGGAEAFEVQTGLFGPGGDLVTRARQFEPRREHAGCLRSLSGSKQCEHVFKETLRERIRAV